ncbi:uncharacterized protein Dwil_GK25487 [Drosophila willistoni]|uniref:Sec16 Sec23-binding domain-containing protein n=1 Tax=Drosophila willistoni TaxID=7260 RepID=B4NDP4_DROWI|nr:uncharacterized protein Dwil_GK25487 [Drosophila willistoni]
MALPESIGATPTMGAAGGGNPFKRSTGPSQRVNILAATAAQPPNPPQPQPSSLASLPTSTIDPMFTEPPPHVDTTSILSLPPAPAPLASLPPVPAPTVGVIYNQVSLPSRVSNAAPAIEPSDVPKPFNHSFGIYENQEVLAAPNDERAQYLQTSHLSEQPTDAADDGEANWEADDDDDQLLPPPGLSRLVLGQPELEQQRLVTGTEQPIAVQAVHMPERQADGEDTSDGEQLASRSPPHRVVTGVETTALPSLPLQREQREVVLDGENLEDQEAAVPVGGVLLPSAAQSSILAAAASAISVEQSSEEITTISQPPAPTPSSQSQQRNQQLPTRPKPRSGHSLELDSEDESDELLLSERERDRVTAADHRRDLPTEEHQKRRSGRRSGSHYNNYDGETEDSIRGGGNGGGIAGSAATGSSHGGGEGKPSRDRDRRSHDQQRNRRGLDADQDRERERNWRRRSQKYHSGGEDQERYDHSNSRRGYGNNSSLYDGESDAPDMADLDVDNNVGSGPASSSKGSRNQRRSAAAAADDDYDDYDHQRGHYRGGRSGGPKSSLDKSRSSGRRSYEQRDRRLDDSTLERERDRRRRHHPDQRHWDGYEEYRRKSSRNSDLEKERTNNGGGSNATGGSKRRSNNNNSNNNTSSSNYDPYTASPAAYDPYGMYEQMSRNPHAYADMYAKFYGQILDAAAAKQFVAAAAAQAQVAAANIAPGSEAALLRERERAEIAGDVSSTIPGYASAATPTPLQGGMEVARPPRRRTPLQFNRPHLVASYAMSLLLKVKPKYAGRGRLRNDVEVAAPRIKDATSSLFRSYPGPLQGRKLHKDKIISFCKEQIRLGPTRQCTVLYATQKKPQGNVDKYRASHALMWNLLILLLRQNGYIADTDVGDLLLENQHEYPYSPTEVDNEMETENEVEGDTTELQATEASENLDASDAAAAQQQQQVHQGDDVHSGPPSGNQPVSEQAAIDQFRSYVLRGNVEEALQWATDNNLWTHAFFLALYEDRYALTDVAQKFLNKAIKANDPLQTLYQMKSCHTPACVSQLKDEQWGDWRSHLSILVTNKSRQPEYDRSSVVALGDTLFQRGDIYAAHFCYLVAQEEFGRYDSTATEQTTLTANVPKLILLGASHYKHFNEFASNEAIIMTEIYEYARSLFDQKFSIANFQHYKFLLATRILDYGQHFRCTNYLEQIARHIEIKPESYDSDFIQRVYNLAERLRYHDPILMNRVFFASPPNAAANGSSSSNNNKDTLSEEKTWLRQLRALADTTTYPQQQQQQLQNDIDQQFAEVNKQFRELNMQYDDTLQVAKDAAQPTDLQQQPNVQQPEYYEQPHPEQETLNDPNGQLQQQQPQQAQVVPPPMFYDPSAVQQQAATGQYGHIEPSVEAYGGQPLEQQQQHHQQQPQDPSLYGQPAAATTGAYDYWAGTQQPPYGDEHQHQQARPAISMPKSKSYDDDDDTNRGADATNDAKPSAGAGKPQSVGGAGAGGRDLGAPGNQNAGWFGGLWNKLSLKPKNQMILPDDKNPTIVWDKERKCWTNTEGNADEQESFKPPPKMSDMGLAAASAPAGAVPPSGPPAPPNVIAANTNSWPQETLQQSQVYGANPMEYAAPPAVASAVPTTMPDAYGAAAAAAPTVAPLPVVNPAPTSNAPAVPGGAQPKLTSNIFKMQRNRTLKNSYVDVFNPSGAPMSAAPENVLAPVIAPAAVPQGGYFVPGQQQHYQQQQ